MLLLVSNIGLAFNVHYCGDNIASISLKNNFYQTNNEVNCCEVIEKNPSCCTDKLIKIEKKSENRFENTLSFSANFDFLIQKYNPVVFIKQIVFKNCKITSYTCNANAPPIFKRNCQLIFYA